MSPLLCRLDRLQQKLLLIVCTWYFQWVKGLYDSIVLVVSLLVAVMKELVTLKQLNTQFTRPFPSCQSGLAHETSQTEGYLHHNENPIHSKLAAILIFTLYIISRVILTLESEHS